MGRKKTDSQNVDETDSLVDMPLYEEVDDIPGRKGISSKWKKVVHGLPVGKTLKFPFETKLGAAGAASSIRRNFPEETDEGGTIEITTRQHEGDKSSLYVKVTKAFKDAE